jgi:alkaline phosphatase
MNCSSEVSALAQVILSSRTVRQAQLRIPQESKPTTEVNAANAPLTNLGIALNDDGLPLGTVLEAAHLQGMLTGLVTTSRITHATPASFIAHIYDRDLEDKIAELQVGEGHPMGPVVDVMLGGGKCFFLPNTTSGSCRKDTKDVVAIGKKNGYNVLTDRSGFDALQKGANATKPYLGVFTSGHMSYEVDRNHSKEPSLLEMSETALTTLEKWSEEKGTGFFIMIEAAR